MNRKIESDERLQNALRILEIATKPGGYDLAEEEIKKLYFKGTLQLQADVTTLGCLCKVLASMCSKVCKEGLQFEQSRRPTMLSKSIYELKFSVRALDGMKELGISTVGDLVACSGYELLKTKGFAKSTLFEVTEKLRRLNLTLRDGSLED